MLRLLLSTAAILPIGFISWMAGSGETVEPEIVDAHATYSELVTEPRMEALSDCTAEELPVFFDEETLTDHSEEIISEGLEAAKDCGELEVTIVPVLPEEATPREHDMSELRVTELAEAIEGSATETATDVYLELAEEPLQEDVSTLYINGRAAILRIEPEDDEG